MFFLLFFLLLPLIFLVYFSRKYRNPYKLFFLFGKKGAGKSCWMVSLMIKYLKKGWFVYTDIQDIRLEGVRIIDSKDLSKFRPPEFSVVFLDEVGITMDNRQYKTFPPGLRDFFKYVRKMRIIVYMNSQSWDVDKKVRETTDGLALITSVCDCVSIYRPIYNKIVLVDSSAQADSRIAQNLTFNNIFSWRFLWLPAYFKYFDSLEMPSRELIPYSKPTNTVSFKKENLIVGVYHELKRKLNSYLRTHY